MNAPPLHFSTTALFSDIIANFQSTPVATPDPGRKRTSIVVDDEGLCAGGSEDAERVGVVAEAGRSCGGLEHSEFEGDGGGLIFFVAFDVFSRVLSLGSLFFMDLCSSFFVFVFWP